jgi:hypothetical protein
LVTTRPKGPETGANQPVSGKGYFRLTHTLIFGKLATVQIVEIPGFVPDSTARHWRAFLFSGVGVPLNVERHARLMPRAAQSVIANFAAFKRRHTTP